MQAIKALQALLTGAGSVTSLVPAGCILTGVVPLGAPLPAIGLRHISTVEVPPISATPGDTVVRSRIETEVIAKSYADQEAITDAIRLACNYQRGLLDGVRVISILREFVGPDEENPETKLYSKSTDWLVTHYEA